MWIYFVQIKFMCVNCMEIATELSVAYESHFALVILLRQRNG